MQDFDNTEELSQILSINIIMKKVYIGMSADLIHQGHLNIINEGQKLGKVIIGLLTDEAIASYKNIPHLDFKRRKIIIQNIRYVKKVIPQNTLDYVPNLNLITKSSNLIFDDVNPIDDVRASSNYRKKLYPVIIKKVILKSLNRLGVNLN